MRPKQTGNVPLIDNYIFEISKKNSLSVIPQKWKSVAI